MDQSRHSDTTVVICYNCKGKGVYYTDHLTDYHRGEYDTKQYICHVCEGTGLLSEIVVVKYEPYKQPKKWGSGEEDNDEYAPGSQPEQMIEEWGKQLDKVGQLPSFPRPYIKYPTLDNPKPQCPKCGIGLSGVMGYVCSDQYCPTFMKVTC